MKSLGHNPVFDDCPGCGRNKATKHMKAEMLRGKGQSIRILGEGDFVRIGSLHNVHNKHSCSQR